MTPQCVGNNFSVFFSTAPSNRPTFTPHHNYHNVSFIPSLTSHSSCGLVTASPPTTTKTTKTTRDLAAPWNGEIEIAMLDVPAVHYSVISSIVDDIKKASAA
jgi:hypothetical protein